MLAGLGLMGGAAAQAEDNMGWYFGLSGGITGADVSKDDLDQSFVDLFATAVEQGTGATTSAATVGSKLDDSDKTWGVHFGYRFNRYVAAEFGYVDLGRTDYTNEVALTTSGGPFTFDADWRLLSHGPFASVIGLYPIGDKFEVHVRGGLYFSDTRLRVRAVDVTDPSVVASFEVKDSDKDFFGGIGATWNINPSYSLRVEYERYLDVGGDRTDEYDYDVVNVSLLFR
jgi:OOP family OmpA-OmpF porin